ncbi:MAG: protease pro-enzyme activation domain-containing protein [Rudaea sp.]|nr:protease pro-enzyme activation domain-containing protein [Rudaea sp.]
MLRSRASIALLALLCAILSAGTPQPVRAADIDAQNSVAAQQAVVVVAPSVQQITQAINDSLLSPMENNVPPVAARAVGTSNDLGPVDDGLLLDHMLLLLHRPDARELALEQFMAEQTTPGSPNYHKWLTAEQVGEYGLEQTDLNTVTSWLESYGFTINQVHADGVMIDFSGTAEQVRRAFQTEVHNLNVDGVAHIANMSVPQIPTALAPAVVGIVSINNFRPHTNFKPRPDYTVNTSTHLVVPADLATIYNLNPLFNGIPKIDGTGETIVLLEEEDPFTVNDINTFRSTFGLPALGANYSEVHPGNCTDPGNQDDGTDGEVELDIEWAGAAAPGAKLHMASCADTNATFGVVIAAQNLNSANDTARLWSISYGLCEADNGASLNAAFVSTYQTAAARGVSIFVSSGDEGGASCDADENIATQGIAVSGWTSTPYNVSVGGTDFGDSYAGTTSTYWTTTNTATDGSAKSYINEIPWNDSCASVLLATKKGGTGVSYGATGFCNSTTGEENYLSTASGSGGPSNCATGTPASGSGSGGSCRGAAKPSWQSGFLGNPADGVRDIPDVSLFAANGVWGHYFVYCYTDPGAKLGGAPCTGAPSGWSGGGGTSFASPIMAGIQALVNQRTGSAQGNPNPTYYALAKTEYGTNGNANCNSTLGNAVAGTCIFYDVTQGDMDVNCTGTNDCYRPSGTNGVLSTSNASYSPAYKTTTGWDFATGIGSVNATNLVNNWPGVAATKLAFAVVPNASYTSGAAITVKVSVENASGSVITTDSSAVTLALSGGTAGANLSGTTTVNAVAGVATFSGLSVDKVGTGYQLAATDGMLTGASSTPFNITVGAAKTVTFTTQPATNANIAATATIPLVAHVVDGGGNAVSGQSITLAIGNNAGSSTLSVTTNPVTTDAVGDATFANVSLNKVGSSYTLTATDNTTPASTAATSNPFNIIAGAAKTVTLVTQPATNSNIAAAATIPLVAHVADGGGNAVAAQSITLAFGNNPGGSVLSVAANPVATDAGGNATFANVSLNKTGNSYTFTASDGTTPAATAATSNAFNVVAGVAKTMTFTTQPASGSSIAASVTIPLVAHVVDASGNPVSADNIKLSIGTNSDGSTLTVTANPLATNASGDAPFSGVSLNKIGSNYTLKATDSSTPALTAISNTFNITQGPAAGLAFGVQPSETTPGVAISPAVQVSLVDAFGNVETGDSTHSVTLALAAGVDPTFTGGGPIPLVAGVASFTGITLTIAAGGYQLGATTTAGAFTATSNPFMVSSTGEKLAFVQPPVDVAQGALETVQVAVEDPASNVIASDSTTSITLTAPACGTTVTIGTATVVTGVATFDYRFYTPAALTLTASSSDAGSDGSSVFNVTANPDLIFADGFDGCRP